MPATPQLRADLLGRPLLSLSPSVPNLSLEDPLPTPLYGSSYGTVNAMVVDCGNGDDPCPMANARICLIEVSAAVWCCGAAAVVLLLWCCSCGAAAVPALV